MPHSFVKLIIPALRKNIPTIKIHRQFTRKYWIQYKAERLKRLLDSTKEVTVTYGITGAVSYQKAKEEELNLGLDLQGGMNVTLEVEMTGF